jgi:hypothetical protein
LHSIQARFGRQPEASPANIQDYKHHLAACDSGRRNDLDGRGALSEEALAAFTAFFLTVCIDQVTFMESWCSRIGCEPAY